MVREFKLPDVGEGLTEAEIVAWHVEVGDPVTEDQVVAEVETDKAVVEVPSPVDGTVREIRAEPGELVKVGEVIITFDTDEETSSSSQPSADDVEGEAGDGEAADRETGEAAAPETEADDETETPADAEPPAAESTPASKGGRVFAAPSARRLARELGVDISTVQGSGPGGRVTESDVRGAAERTTGEQAASEQDEPRQAVRRVSDDGVDSALSTDESEAGGGVAPAEAAARDRTLATPATRKVARDLGVDIDRVPASEERDGEAVVTETDVRAFAEADEAARVGTEPTEAAEGARQTEIEAAVKTADAGEAEERVERVPYRGIRRTIGQQMERSAYTAPHVTHHDEVDVTDLVETRSRLKQRAEERGSSLSYMPFVVKAVVAGLKEHPYLNSELDEEAEEILLKHYYNVGVATATDAGLMVPVLRNADGKSLLAIADELDELVTKARNRSISREEMQGGTFTITNFGAIGGEHATPIINYPETAILGLGAIKEKPRVVEREARSASDGASGEAASKEIVPRKVLTLSLSIDHRVVDGAVAARFVNTVKEYLESPELLLLE